LTKFVFWGIVHNHRNVAFTEDLSRYARGDTFWKAVKALADILPELSASAGSGETGPDVRMMMFQETGIHKVEIFVQPEEGRFSVRCANSRCRYEAANEQAALRRFIDVRAETSVVNTGEIQGA